MRALSSLVKRHPMLSFFILAYLLTWLGWTMPERIYTGTMLSGLLTLPFMIMVPGPLLAIFLLPFAWLFMESIQHLKKIYS